MAQIIFKRLFFIVIVLSVLIPEGAYTAESLSFPVEASTSPRFWLDVGLFRDSNRQTRVEFYYSVTNQELNFKDAAGKWLASFSFQLSVKDSSNQVVFEETRRKGVRASSEEETIDKTRGAVDQFAFNLPEGDYVLQAIMEDEHTNAASSVVGDIHISGFDERLSMSSPQLATIISSDLTHKVFVKSNKVVVPNASRKYRCDHSILYLYFEVYNLAAPTDSSNSHFQVGYTITNVLGDSLMVVPMESVKKSATASVNVQGLDIRGLDRGEHLLTVTVFEPISTQSIVRKKSFWIYEPELETQILPMSDEDIQKYRDQIKYFAAPEDLKIFDELNPKGKETFLINFWRSKDTNPATPENEFMQDCFSRIAYADKHFKGRTNGLNTDMGRVFVIYGQPDDTENHFMEFETKPYIIWHYFHAGGQHTFVFVDRNNEGIYALVHSTVEGEIKNFDWMDQELN